MPKLTESLNLRSELICTELNEGSVICKTSSGEEVVIKADAALYCVGAP